MTSLWYDTGVVLWFVSAPYRGVVVQDRLLYAAVGRVLSRIKSYSDQGFKRSLLMNDLSLSRETETKRTKSE